MAVLRVIGTVSPHPVIASGSLFRVCCACGIVFFENGYCPNEVLREYPLDAASDRRWEVP